MKNTEKLRMFEVTTENPSRPGEVWFTYNRVAGSAEKAIARVKKEDILGEVPETILGVKQIAMER